MHSRAVWVVRRGVHSWICMLCWQLCSVGQRFCRTILTFLVISHKRHLWSWNWIYCQKAHESGFPTIPLPNGNVVKFSHTNRKHFTVGGWGMYAVKFPLARMARPKFAPKSTPSRWPIPKPHYLPHPWTRRTYDTKRHPDPIRCFSTMHWTDWRTYVQTDRSSTGKFDNCSPLCL